MKRINAKKMTFTGKTMLSLRPRRGAQQRQSYLSSVCALRVVSIAGSAHCQTRCRRVNGFIRPDTMGSEKACSARNAFTTSRVCKEGVVSRFVGGRVRTKGTCPLSEPLVLLKSRQNHPSFVGECGVSANCHSDCGMLVKIIQTGVQKAHRSYVDIG